MNKSYFNLFLLLLLSNSLKPSFLHAQDSLEFSLEYKTSIKVGTPLIKQSFDDTLETYGGNWRSLAAHPEDYQSWYENSDFSVAQGEVKLKGFYLFGELGIYRDFEAQYQSKGTHNIPFAVSEFDFNIPRQAYLGYEHSLGRVQFGRFQYKLGPSPQRGISLSSTTSRDALWAYWNFNQFHAEVYYASLNPWLIDSRDSLQNEFIRQSKSLAPNQRGRIYDDPAKSLMVHRLAWQHPNFTLGLSELAIVGGKYLDFRDFSPITAWHNNFGAGYTNTWLSFDFAWLAKNWQVYAEWSLDDINAGASGGEGADSRPTTSALLLGFQFELDLDWGKWDLTAEWIYVAPTFGLHELPLLQLTDRQRLTSNYRVRAEPDYADHYIIDSPLGYYRGPDVVDLWVDLNWSLKPLGVFSQIGWLQKGENTTRTLLVQANNDPGAPSGKTKREFLIDQSLAYQAPLGFEILTGYHWRASKDEAQFIPYVEFAYIYRL